MNAETWARARALYEDVLELRPEQRTDFLDQNCVDPLLRKEVQDLLAVAGAATQHFSQLAMRVGSSVIDTDSAQVEAESMAGRRVGPYRLLEELGRGGMGIVYLAERADGAFEHRVAVKLLPVGLPRPYGHQRFLAERQILARLQHPSIARLLDGGVTADDTPYIVMEYVDGLPIDLWCDAAALTVEERVKLFLEVCDTIGYAHRNLVVHRDLKPSNVLVTGEAETKLLGQVKLLDFGIAKLIGEDSPELTRDEPGRVPLTPAWASPEQLAGEPVTTSTDVYTLTALLYRLLIGVTPHDVRGCSTDEIRRHVLTGRVVPPSQRLDQFEPEQVASIAACRRSQPEGLRRKLRGDLDTILLKGLARTPEQRYSSPGALASDLRRHLSGHPVKARSATAGYRIVRFLGRHRPAVATAATILCLLGALVWMTLRYAASVAAERDKAQQVTELLLEVFSQSAPDHAGSHQLTARELLDRGADRVRQRLADRPMVRASLLHSLGRVYRQLGHPRRAAALLSEELALLHRAEAGDAELAAALHELGLARLDEGRAKRAATHLREAVARRRAALGERHPAVAESLTALADALSASDEHEGAVQALEQAVEIQRQSLPPQDAKRAQTLFALGMALHFTKDFDGMRRAFEEAVPIFEQQPEALTENYATSLSVLAAIYDTRGRTERAEVLFNRAIEAHRAVYGDEHRATVLVLLRAAAFAEGQGALDRAEAHAQEAAVLASRLDEPDEATVARADSRLASIHLLQGRIAEAEVRARQALAIWEHRGDDDVAGAYQLLGRILSAGGAMPEAKEHLEIALQLSQETLGEEHPMLAPNYLELGRLASRQGHFEEAETHLRTAYRGFQESLGADRPATVDAAVELAESLSALGRASEAVDLLDLAWRSCRSLYGADHAKTLETENMLQALRYGSRDAAAGDIRGSVRTADRLRHDQ